MKKLNIVFMGTPQFASNILEGLIKRHEIVLVVTQPDTFLGRHKILTPSKVKEVALKHDIKVFQPHNIRQDFQKVLDVKPDLIVTAAYGQFVPSELIDLIPSINIHGSLLPLYRGGAPIQKAIMDGMEETGITIIHMTKKMDAGHMIVKKSLPILAYDTYSSLNVKLSQLGLDTVIDVLETYGNRLPLGEPQDITKVSFAPILRREDERLYFHFTQDKFLNHMRALLDVPVGHIVVSDTAIKVYDAVKSDIIQSGMVGEVMETKGKLIIMCQDGPIELLSIQIPGKQKMDVKSFLNGQKIFKVGQVII